MRRRVLVIALALFVGCLAGFAAAGETASVRIESASGQTTTTTEPVRVDVEAKVVEQGPLKDPVDIADLAQTGSESAGALALVGLALVAVGLVLVDVVSGGQSAAGGRGRARPREEAPRS